MVSEGTNMACYLTTEDVRNFMFDRTLDDNELLLDLAFEDDEIRDAMKRAAAEFNSIPPYVKTFQWNNLPGDSNMFLYGTAVHLYTSELAKLRRNDVDYQAGGMGVNLVDKRIAHLMQERQEFRQLFREEATNLKIRINLDQAYRSF